jgi:hypothetical protein
VSENKSESALTPKMRNLLSGMSAAQLRQLVKTHGGSEETSFGPVYVPCKCAHCEAARELISEISEGL